LLAIAVCLLLAFVFALTRQIKILYRRVAPAGALMVNKILRPGMRAPELDVNDSADRTVAIGGDRDDGKCQLLFFVSPTCPISKQIIGAVKSAARREEKWLNVVLASDGEELDHRSFVARHGLESFPYIVSERLGISFGVSKVPYGVLIDEAGSIAALGIVNSREHLESLFEAKERNVPSIQAYLSDQASGMEIVQ
jgi:methylamine dehydrogenase accessory protein MauD